MKKKPISVFPILNRTYAFYMQLKIIWLQCNHSDVGLCFTNRCKNIQWRDAEMVKEI